MTAVALPVSDAVNAYELLSDIALVVLDEPKRIQMNVVCLRGEGLTRARLAHRVIEMPACGAVGCVAGWALLLTNRTQESENNGTDTYDARQLLGLTERQASHLFYPSDLLYATDYQTEEHAREVVTHIREFQHLYREQLRATPISQGAPS